MGTAAVQVARMTGAEVSFHDADQLCFGIITGKANRHVKRQVFCTVGGEEQVDYVTTRLGVPRDHVFTPDEFSAPDIVARTNGRGVDVVFNSSSDGLAILFSKCLAEFGTFIDTSDRESRGQDRPAVQSRSNQTYIGVDLAQLTIHRPHMVGDVLQRVIALWKEGRIGPTAPAQEYSALHISEAFRDAQLSEHTGRLVLSMPAADEFPAEAVDDPLQFSGDRSYLFVGGLGGLGRVLSTWLAERGAGEVVFLSRSAGSSPEHVQFAQELATLGCEAKLVAGDVAKYEDVVKAVMAATRPLGGVLQASLVLRDASFSNMGYEDWVAASEPKVQGTWNLHNAILEKQPDTPLDFFLLFSSTAATGGWYGQANYHAGNTFVEAFANYRQQRGLAASVLNVGFIRDAGFVAENAAAAEAARSMGQWFNTETELLECIELLLKRPRGGQPEPEDRTANGLGPVQRHVQPSLLAMGMRSTTPVASSRMPWRKDRRMLAYRNFEAHQLKSSAAGGSGSSSNDKLTQFIRDSRSNISVLQSPETPVYLGTEMGKALFDLIMRGDEQVNVEAPLASIGLDSLVSLELKSWIRRWMGVEVATLEILNCATLHVLGAVVQGKLLEKHQS